MSAKKKRSEAARALKAGVDLTVEAMEASEEETGTPFSVVSHVLENGTLVIVARGWTAEHIEGEMLRAGICRPLRRGDKL